MYKCLTVRSSSKNARTAIVHTLRELIKLSKINKEVQKTFVEMVCLYLFVEMQRWFNGYLQVTTIKAAGLPKLFYIFASLRYTVDSAFYNKPLHVKGDVREYSF